MKTSYLETTSREISDFNFRLLFSELCACANFDENDYINERLSFLLTEICRRKRKLTKEFALITKILDEKVGKLPKDSVVRSICQELINLNGINGKHIEHYSGTSVFTLIMRLSKVYLLKPAKPKKLGKFMAL